MERINDKITEIKKYLKELEPILPKNLEEYLKSFEKKAACERYLEKITEAICDLAYLIIKEQRLELENYEKVFDVLFENKIISENVYIKMKNAKGMRNIIAHRYGELDDNLIFESITKNLITDANKFTEEIQNKFPIIPK